MDIQYQCDKRRYLCKKWSGTVYIPWESKSHCAGGCRNLRIRKGCLYQGGLEPQSGSSLLGTGILHGKVSVQLQGRREDGRDHLQPPIHLYGNRKGNGIEGFGLFRCRQSSVYRRRACRRRNQDSVLSVRVQRRQNTVDLSHRCSARRHSQ